MRCNKHGQVTAELAVLFAFVIAGFVFMGAYMQRGVQGSTKANADAVGTQYSSKNPWSSFSASSSNETNAGLVTSTSCSNTEHDLTAVGGGLAVTLAGCVRQDGSVRPLRAATAATLH